MSHGLPEKVFSYAAGSLATSALYRVRFLIGDTDPDDVQLDDGEISFLIDAAEDDTTVAAMACCRALIAKYSRLVDSAVSDVRFSYSQRVRQYQTLLAEIEAGGGIPSASGLTGLPYSGGTSIADMETAVSDTDRPEPEFAIGMMDNEDTTGVIGR